MNRISTKSDPVKQFRKHLHQNLPLIRSLFATDLRSSTIFLVPHLQSDVLFQSEVEAMRQQLAFRFQVQLRRFTSDDPPLANSAVQPPNGLVLSALILIAVPEDLAKEAIGTWYRTRNLQPTTGAATVRLRNYGALIPRTCEITCHSFPHGVGHYYRFRVAHHNVSSAPKPLLDYLLTLPASCPNQYFLSGPRASNCTANIQIQPAHTPNHPIISLARTALAVRKYKSAHEDVEKFMLMNDPETIATEVPIWLEPSEMPLLGGDRGLGQALTGHIDILRCEGNMIAIWDFKPKAASERMAALQVFLYAFLLSIRTGISINNFRCGYFDDQDAFEFMAAEIPTPPKLNSFGITPATY